MDNAVPLKNAFAVGSVVVSIQLVLAWNYWRKVGNQRRAIERLKGRTFSDVPASPPSFPWLIWVRDRFGGTKPATTSREDAVREFDRRQVTGLRYLILGRIGMMAPLLGLILTAYSTYEFQRDRMELLAQAGPPKVLAEVLPLFAGVAVGAALALINQLLMIVVALKTTSLRSVAMEWFDQAIVLARSKLPPDPLVGASAQVEAAAGRLTKVTEMLGRAVIGLTGASESVGRTTAGLEKAVAGLADGQARHIKALDDSAACFARLETATGELATHCRQLATSAGKTVADLAQVSESWRTTTEGAARANHQAAQFGVGAARSLASATTQVEEAARGWAGAVAAQQDGLNLLRDAATSYIANQSSFADAMDRFEQGSLAFVTKTELVGRAFEQTSNQLESFQQAADRFGSAVHEDLVPAAEALRAIPEGVIGLVSSTRQVGEATRVLDEVIKAYYRDAAGIAPAVESLQGQLEGADELGGRLREMMNRVDEGLKATLAGLKDSSSTFQADLAGASRGLQAAIGRLDAALNQNLGPLAAAADPLSRLHTTLAGLDALTKNLKNLPASTGELGRAASGAATTLREVEGLSERLKEFEDAIRSATGGATQPRPAAGFWRFFGLRS